jgi:hypothetical protein
VVEDSLVKAEFYIIVCRNVAHFYVEKITTITFPKPNPSSEGQIIECWHKALPMSLSEYFPFILGQLGLRKLKEFVSSPINIR